MFDIYEYDEMNKKMLEIYNDLESKELVFVVCGSCITMLYLITYFIQN